MSRFWVVANILDFFFCLAMIFIVGTEFAPWIFALIFLIGDLAITMVAALVDGVDDWWAYAIYCFANYFVMLTYLIAVADVGLVIYFMTGGVMAMSLLLKFCAFNVFVIVIWLLCMKTNRAVDDQLKSDPDDTEDAVRLD